MPIVNLTDRFVTSLKPAVKAVEWFDEVTRGLSLKMSPGGASTYYFNYTHPPRRWTSSPYPDWSGRRGAVAGGAGTGCPARRGRIPG